MELLIFQAGMLIRKADLLRNVLHCYENRTRLQTATPACNLSRMSRIFSLQASTAMQPLCNHDQVMLILQVPPVVGTLFET